jgi:hypothetical protein
MAGEGNYFEEFRSDLLFRASIGGTNPADPRPVGGHALTDVANAEGARDALEQLFMCISNVAQNLRAKGLKQEHARQAVSPQPPGAPLGALRRRLAAEPVQSGHALDDSFRLF